MHSIQIRSMVLAVVFVFAIATGARGNTILPLFDSFTPGVQIVYDATLGASELRPPDDPVPGSEDGFTIFDVGGFVTVTSMPAGWSFSTTNFGSPFGGPPIISPDSVLTNVHFTWTGLPTIVLAGIHQDFTITTTSTSLVLDSFVSRDHVPADLDPTTSPFIVGPSIQGPILVPAAVPDQGSTMTLLGLAMLSIGLLRRHLF
jgi:hypothetical protein